MRVLVTGSAGRLAQALLPRLCASPKVERVVGVDLNPAQFAHPRFTAHRLDIRSPAVARHMTGCDAVIHLAFVVMRGTLGRRRHDRAWIHDINLHGSINVFQCAARQGVRHLIHLSSAAVYGGWPDNPPRITERQPLRPLPGFAYAEDKAAVEAWLDGFEAQTPDMRVVRLRPHVILGTNAHPLLASILHQPFHPRLPDPQPLFQCVWEDDVAEAARAALLGGVRGSFNLAAEPALPFRDMLRRVHRVAWPVPMVLIRRAHRALWRFTGAAGEPGWVDGLRYSLVIDSTRARRELQWQPRASVHECLDRTAHTTGH